MDIDQQRKETFRVLRKLVRDMERQGLKGSIDGFYLLAGRFINESSIIFSGARRGTPNICKELSSAFLSREVQELVKRGLDLDHAFEVIKGWTLEGLTKDARHQGFISIYDFLQAIQAPHTDPRPPHLRPPEPPLDWENFWNYMNESDNTENGREEEGDGPTLP